MRENFRLLSFDASGYGRSTQPLTGYTIEGWADEGAGLLDALGIDRCLNHGTSMGGMIALAFTAKYPDKTIASCADCAMARCDVYRRTMFRNWRQQCEALPMDDFCELLTIQAVGADFVEENPDIFDTCSAIVDPELALHGAPGVPRDGDDGPRAARRRDPAADPASRTASRDIMTPPRPRALGLQRARRSSSGCPTGRASTSSPTIGHADLLEIPDEAVRVVTAFFKEVLAGEEAGRRRPRRGARRSAGRRTRVPLRPRRGASGRTRRTTRRAPRCRRRSWSGCRR